MPRFVVGAHVTISVSKVIEAASPEEAVEYAERELSLPDLCIGCSSSMDPELWDVGELDGEPCNITAEAGA